MVDALLIVSIDAHKSQSTWPAAQTPENAWPADVVELHDMAC
jgi:hypothetical protein